MTQALVPFKDLVRAKTRLAGLLRPSERRAVAQAMAEDVLAVLSNHVELTQVTLVSDDPGADLLADKYGITCWTERSLGCRGLNAVVECASARLLQAGVESLLVLHADLPLLTEADISAALELQRQTGGLVIGCDRHGTGSNLLAFDTDSVPQFSFGVDSRIIHEASARSAGIPVEVVQRPGISLDVDEPQDLMELMAALEFAPSGYTAALLRGTSLGARVSLSLATLLGGGELLHKGTAS